MINTIKGIVARTQRKNRTDFFSSTVEIVSVVVRCGWCPGFLRLWPVSVRRASYYRLMATRMMFEHYGVMQLDPPPVLRDGPFPRPCPCCGHA